VKPKPFPKLPQEPDYGISFDVPSPKPSTACKHGLGECEQCGTSERKDMLHTTTRGVGKVGKLFRR